MQFVKEKQSGSFNYMFGGEGDKLELMLVMFVEVDLCKPTTAYIFLAPE